MRVLESGQVPVMLKKKKHLVFLSRQARQNRGNKKKKWKRKEIANQLLQAG